MVRWPASRVRRRRLRGLLEQAWRDDLTCLPTLRQTLEEHPELWRQAMNLVESIEHPLLLEISEDVTFVAEALMGQLENMRQAAGGDTSLEKLLAEYRIAAWLFHRLAEQRLAAEPDSRRLQRACHAARWRLDQTERYLATVRRLLWGQAWQRSWDDGA
jgi:hypothetical protein